MGALAFLFCLYLWNTYDDKIEELEARIRDLERRK